MKTIYKYSTSPQQLNDEGGLIMPVGATVLSIAMQGPALCFWALVEPDYKPEFRPFRIFGTGHPIDQDPGKHIATVFDGPFVRHIFEPGHE